MQPLVEVGGRVSQPEGLQLDGPARSILAQEDEVPGIGHQHQPVAVPVPAHLPALRRQPGVGGGGLDLDDSAFGKLPFPRLSPLDLLRAVKAKVGMPRTLLRQFADAEDLGLERRAHRIQQVGQRRVVGPLPGGAPRRADAAQVVKVGFDGCRKFVACPCHDLYPFPERGQLSSGHQRYGTP